MSFRSCLQQMWEKTTQTFVHRKFWAELISKLSSETTTASPATTAQKSRTKKVSINILQGQDNSFVLLPTAVVHIACRGGSEPATILFNSCSQVSIVSEDFVRKNGILISYSINNCVQGVNSKNMTVKHAVTIFLTSRYDLSEISVSADIISATALANRVETFR